MSAQPAASPTLHPAGEIVAIALRKIKKVANSRKYQALLDECQAFLENISTIIPPLAPGSSVQASALSAALRTQAETAAEAAAEEEQHRAAAQGPEAPHVAQGEEGAAPAAPAEEPASTSHPAPTLAEVKAHFAEEDIAEAASASNAFALGDSRVPTPGGAAPSAAGGAGGEGAVGAAMGLPDLVPRTEVALPDAVCLRIIGIMRLAVETTRPNIIEIALDCVQKLIAFKFLQGAAYAINVERPGKDAVDACECALCTHTFTTCACPRMACMHNIRRPTAVICLFAGM